MPIVNVGDKGNIKSEITGKNLWQFEESCSSKIGKMTVFVKDGTPFTLHAGTYTFSCKGTLGNTDAPLFLTLEDKTKIQAFRILHNEKNFKKTFTIAKKAISIEFVSNAAFGTDGTIYNIQLERNSVTSSYTPYTPVQSLTLQTPNGLPGIKVERDGNYTDKDGQQWISDEITMVERIQRIGRIASYNGEQIDTEYMSSYGELSTGAEVIYVLKESIVIPLTEEEISMFKEMHTNYPITTVLNDENADMELTYTVDTQSYVDTKIAEISKAIL